MVLLKEMLEKKQMNQTELAKLSGVPQQTISSLVCNSQKNPTIDTLYALAVALGCDLFEIYIPETGSSPEASTSYEKQEGM